MSATIFTAEEAAKSKIELITDEQKGRQAVHDVVVAIQAARRSGTASVKTIAQVNRSGRKPWRQKGTGRARAGDFSSPIWVGGGVAHGPKPRDYSKNVPKQVKKLAFRKALSARILAGDVLVVETFTVNDAKTKQFVSLVADAAKDARKTLVVGAQFDENTFRAARNVQTSLLATASDVNTEQLLAFDKIIVTRDAVAKLAERLSKMASSVFDHIQTVILTEKATLLSESLNKYVFRVSPDANKLQIKHAVERLFKKTVVDVNTANYAGKKKRERRADFGRKPHWKKAIVTLKAGEKLDLV